MDHGGRPTKVVGVSSLRIRSFVQDDHTKDLLEKNKEGLLP
jgi:hypothetical protein